MATVWYQQGTGHNLRPEMIDGLQEIRTLFMKNEKSLFVTSANEGDHQQNSLHFSGLAVDFLKAEGITKEMIEKALGDSFDVVEYSWGYHVEYDVDQQLYD